MESSGAVLTTTEAALFEWCETAAAPEFKQISRLVREAAPEGGEPEGGEPEGGEPEGGEPEGGEPEA
jgi:hypothetical protein